MLYTGEIIKGKWNKNSYIVLQKLGQGGIGSIFKVKDKYGNVKAIKISSDINSITREYENMKRFKMMSAIPKAYEIDDYKKYGETFHFFTLEYISGYNLKELMRLKRCILSDIIIIGTTILKNLKVIYDLGYIYGDIKLENIMIDAASKKIYLIDFGGAVEKGQGIKEYTPTYNIVSWGMDNKDNSTSMIFSVNMILTSLILKHEPSPLLKDIKAVALELKNNDVDNRLKRILLSGLGGKHKSVDKYMQELKSINSRKSKYKDIDIIDFIFKGSIFMFMIVLTIGVSKKWM